MVDLRDKGARRVDHGEIAARGRLGADLGRHPVGGQDHRGAVGHLVELLDEHRTARLQARNDMRVVHDLATDVDRGAEPFDGPLHDLDGPLDPRAERARRGELDPAGRHRARPCLEGRSDLAQRGQRLDAAPQRSPVERVGNRADHDERQVAQGVGQPRRLHVGGQHPVGSEGSSLGAPGKARHRENGSQVNRQTGALELRRHEPGRRERSRPPVDRPQLRRDHEVAGGQSRRDATGDADHRHCDGAIAHLELGRGGALGPHPDHLDPPADGQRLDAQRAQHQEVSHDRPPLPGSARARTAGTPSGRGGS